MSAITDGKQALAHHEQALLQDRIARNDDEVGILTLELRPH